MLRVYNEGSMAGYAAQIKDHLPEYLEFVDGDFNKKYGWEVSEMEEQLQQNTYQMINI